MRSQCGNHYPTTNPVHTNPEGAKIGKAKPNLNHKASTRVLREYRPPPRQVKICNWENPDYFLYPEVDPDHSQNLMGSKLDQDLSFVFFRRIQPVVFA